MGRLFEWVAILLAVLFLFVGCTFTGSGKTSGKRALGLRYRIDTSLTWETESEGEVAENEETLSLTFSDGASDDGS